jgi:hypothetical protein
MQPVPAALAGLRRQRRASLLVLPDQENAHHMKKLIIAVTILVALAVSPALAQEARPERRIHVAPTNGVYLPTGNQRDVLDHSLQMGLTLGYDVNRYLAVLGSFSWSPTKVKRVSRGDLDLFQYDLGLQGQYPLSIGRGVVLMPFVGAGLGARTYSFRDLNIGSETDCAGYVAAGGALQYRFIELTISARDYVSRYEGLHLSHVSTTRNDVGLSAALGFRF